MAHFFWDLDLWIWDVRLGRVGQLEVKRLVKIIAGAAIASAVAFFVVPALLPIGLGAYRPDILFRVEGKGKMVFLTIDDSPSDHTGEILAVLRKHQVPATFFITASRVESSAQLDRIAAEGYAMSNHLYGFEPASTLSMEQFRADFEACAEVLSPYPPSGMFRPASGFGTADQIAYVRSQGVQSVMGTVFPLDHWISDHVWLARIAQWLVVRGGIIVLHDGPTRGETTAAVLNRLIPELKRQGYTFGRLEELLPPFADKRGGDPVIP